MTVRLSTGLRSAMCGTVGFAGAMANGVIEIRTGSQPPTADSPATGTLLGIMTLGGGAFTTGSPTNGLTFAVAADGKVVKTGEWKMIAIAAGVVGYGRFKGNAVDAGGMSTTAVRADGTAGEGANFRFPQATVEIGTPITLDQWEFRIPFQPA